MSEHLHARVSPVLKRWLESVAERDHCSVGEVVRRLLWEAKERREVST